MDLFYTTYNQNYYKKLVVNNNKITFEMIKCPGTKTFFETMNIHV